MSKLAIFAVALLMLFLAAAALYRLLYWFPITIGGADVGQTASFFILVICAALSAMLFRSGIVQR